MGAADSPSDVQLLVHNAVPEPLTCRKHLPVIRQPCHIRHAAVKVHPPHCMPHGLRLLPDGQMGLMVLKTQIPESSFRSIRRTVSGSFLRLPVRCLPGPALMLCPLPVLNVKIIRPCAPHFQKETPQLQIPLLPGELIEPCQRHLRNLMPGIALALSLLLPEPAADKVRVPLRRLQKLILSGGLIIRHRALHKMPEAIQLMMVSQIGENTVHAVDDIICIQITILRLCRADNVNGLVRGPLQGLVGTVRQGIPHRLYPLGEIAVLKNKAVKPVRVRMLRILRQCLKAPEGIRGRGKARTLFPFFPHQPSSHPEIAHAKAGCRPGNPVVQRLPLIGDYLPAHQLHLIFPEGIRNPDIPQ